MTTSTIRLYNTFTRTKEELKPLRDGVVRLYSCGPTVYRYVHVGNLRTFMLPDLLRRSLEYLGYETEQVMNITDVGHLTDDTFDRGEDKMLVSARLENKSPEEIAAYYTSAFMDDAAKLNIRRADHFPHATHYIPQMIELIEKLIARGHAYEVGGTVYYDIATFPAYGKLSRNTTDKLLAGARGRQQPAARQIGYRNIDQIHRAAVLEAVNLLRILGFQAAAQDTIDTQHRARPFQRLDVRTM